MADGVPGFGPVRAAAGWLRRRLGGKREDAAVTLRRLEAALWGGLSTYAVPEIARLSEAATSPDVRDDAARTLAAWHLENGDPERALGYARGATGAPAGRGCALLAAEALILLGRTGEAKAAVERLMSEQADRPEPWFARANLALLAASGASGRGRAEAWLQAVNHSLLAAGMSPLAMADAAKGLSLANIAVPTAPSAEPAPATISVIMPVYNAAATVGLAIHSLLRQTWTNVEVLAVDDCSTDASWDVVSGIAEKDGRVVAIRHEANRGAYPAMNTGLARAGGAFVMTHGADDWSHPEKLARQVQPLIEGPAACTVSWAVRVAPDMRVDLKPRTASHLFPNVSSLLFRRQELDALGGWDAVRFDADAEIYARYRARFGKSRLDVLPAVPLSLISASPQTLTRSRATGLASIGYGARRQYREAYSHWHRLEAAKSPHDLRCGPGLRPFPAPRLLLERDPGTQRFDVALVSDFAAPDPLRALNLALLRQALAANLSMALFHWPLPAFAGRSIDRAIRGIMHDRNLASLVAGERAACRLALLSHADILAFRPDSRPEIVPENLIIRIDPAPAEGAAQRLADLGLSAFGREPIFMPTSRQVRRLVLAEGVRLSECDWPAAFPADSPAGAFAELAAGPEAAFTP